MMDNKWYSLSVSETEKELGTNAASGLTRKAARSRVIKSGENDFFYVECRSILSCLKAVFAEPMLLLLIGLDIIAFIFGETAVAIAAGILILINITVSFVSFFKSQRIMELMSVYSQPKLRVIRNGELYLADSRCIVKGDVIIVGKGDVLPCDARIISSDGLKVRVYLGENAKESYVDLVPDDKAVYSPDSNLESNTHLNMLYAGSEILAGEARAIVVETGETTYIGALEGGISLNDSMERPSILRDMKKFSRIYGFISLILIIPMTLIGVFSYGTDSMLSTSMLTISLAVSSLGELVYVFGNIISARAIYDAAVSHGKYDSAIIKSLKKCELFAKADRLLILDRSALTDGKKRVVSVYAAGKERSGEEMLESDVVAAAESFTVLIDTVNSNLSLNSSADSGLPKDFNDFANRVGVDRARIKISVAAMSSFISNGRFYAKVSDGGKMLSLSASTNERVIDDCSYESVGGENIVLGTEKKAYIKKFFRKAIESGCETYAVTMTNSSAEILMGVFCLKETVSRAVKEKVLELKNANVLPLLFLESEQASEAFLALDAGFISKRSEIAYASSLRAEGRKIADVADRCRLFLGFSDSEKKEYTEYLRKNGHTVAAFASSVDEIGVWSAADVKITCDRASYGHQHNDFEKLYASSVSGEGTSPDGAQSLRLSADLLVKRAGPHGGGAGGILNAVAESRRLHKNLVRIVTYLLCSQLIRIIFVVPGIFFGKILISPFHLLFGGLIIDLGAAFIIAADKHEKTAVKKKFRSTRLNDPVRLCKRMLNMTALSAGSEVITALITVMIGKDHVSGAVFLSVTLSQFILLLILRLYDAPRFKDNIALVVFFSVTAIAVTLFSIIPNLASVTGTLYSLESLVCIAILPLRILIWFIYTQIKRWIQKKREKKTQKSY